MDNHVNALRIGPASNDKCLCKRCGRKRGKDWGEAVTAAERPGPRSRKRRVRKRVPSSLQREHGPADTLTLNFWPQNRERMHSCCSQLPSLWCFVSADAGVPRPTLWETPVESAAQVAAAPSGSGAWRSHSPLQLPAPAPQGGGLQALLGAWARGASLEAHSVSPGSRGAWSRSHPRGLRDHPP